MRRDINQLHFYSSEYISSFSIQHRVSYIPQTRAAHNPGFVHPKAPVSIAEYAILNVLSDETLANQILEIVKHQDEY